MKHQLFTKAERTALGLIVDTQTFAVARETLLELEHDHAERAARAQPLPQLTPDEAEWDGEVL